MENVMFILYVRSALAPDRKVINMIPDNAPILVQEITKLPKPYPPFLDGSPILTEPARNKVFRGSEVIEILQLYLGFLRFHPYALLSKAQITQQQPQPEVLQPPPAALKGFVVDIPEDPVEIPAPPASAPAPVTRPIPNLAPLSPLLEPPRKRSRPT